MVIERVSVDKMERLDAVSQFDDCVEYHVVSHVARVGHVVVEVHQVRGVGQPVAGHTLVPALVRGRKIAGQSF